MIKTHASSRKAGQETTGWFVGHIVHDLWQRFRSAAQALPKRVWQRWFGALLAGLAFTCLVALGFTLGARWWQPRGLQTWDQAALAGILEQAPMSFSRAIVFETPGNLIGMALLILPVVIIAIYAGRSLVVASILAAYTMGSAVFFTGWGVWNRSRPDVVADGIAAPGFHAFPSGHMVHVTAVYGYLTFLWLRAARNWIERMLALLLCAVWMTLVGLSRLVLGTHWPSDIIAGGILGLLWAIALAFAQHFAEADR
jgi:membrane-associated phospholipid phosphatase